VPRRAKLLVISVLLAASLAAWGGTRFPPQHWLIFLAYLVAVLLSSGMKVCLPGSDSTMSVNFPFILLAVLQLSPSQAMILAAISVFAQCKFRVQKLFSVVQIGFNVANAVNATAVCWLTFIALRQLHLAAAPALAAGATAYFFVNTIPVALIVAWTSGAKGFVLWRANFAWFLPFYLVGAALSVTGYFLGTHYGLATALLELPAVYTIYRSYNAQIARMRDREQHIADMEALHVRTIESLAMAIEAKDHDTHDHLLRVRVYVTELSNALHLSKDEIRAVKTAALLHDIGKLAVPERIINKPGKLTPEEFEIMKIHPVVGADILERVHFPYPVVPIVRAHHEWWNGMGYPDGLRGEAIPIGARILTVVDSFDAMVSDRPYRRAMPLQEAMTVIKKLSGTQFDPQIVDALEQSFTKLEEKARLEGEKLPRLNTEVHVSRGEAPGAGFEQDSGQIGREESVGQQTFMKERYLTSLPNASFLIAAMTEQMQVLLSKTESTGYPLNFNDTLTLLISGIASLIPCCCIVFYLKEGDELVPQGMRAPITAFFSPGTIPMGEGLSGWVAKHEHSIVNGNAAVEPIYIPQRRPEQDLRSALSLPLRDLEDGVFGVFSLYAAGTNAFSRDHLRALEAVETTMMLVLKNSMRTGMVRHATLEATPAEIPFESLDAAIERCRASSTLFSLLLSDARPADDPASAKLLHNGVRSSGELTLQWGRLWVLLLQGASRGQATRRAEVIRESAALSRGMFEVRTAVGIACFPEDGQTAETLIARAERRMHRDKRQQAMPMPASVA